MRKQLTVNSKKLKTPERGVMIYLAMLIMSSALATALFVSSVFMREFRIARDVGDSVRAVYVADSAMEYALYTRRVSEDYSNFSSLSVSAFEIGTASCAGVVSLDAVHAKCKIDLDREIPLGSAFGCSDPPPCTTNTGCTVIKTKGAYGDTNRALEIVFPNC